MIPIESACEIHDTHERISHQTHATQGQRIMSLLSSTPMHGGYLRSITSLQSEAAGFLVTESRILNAAQEDLTNRTYQIHTVIVIGRSLRQLPRGSPVFWRHPRGRRAFELRCRLSVRAPHQALRGAVWVGLSRFFQAGLVRDRRGAPRRSCLNVTAHLAQGRQKVDRYRRLHELDRQVR